MKEPLAPPSLNDDGTHVIPLKDIHYRDCETHPDASGELRWHPERGAILTVRFPGVSHRELARYFRPRSVSGEGRLHQPSSSVDCSASTAEGGAVRISELNSLTESTDTADLNGRTYESTVITTAFTASVEFTQANPLSFWHQTPAKSRAMFLGFGCTRWQETDEVVIDDGTYRQTVYHGFQELRESPRLRLMSAGRMNLPREVSTCWLVTDEDAESLENPDYEGFISLLNGRRTPFFWRDSFLDSGMISRIYRGWHKAAMSNLHESYEQPLPLYGTVEALKHGHELIPLLPGLFSSFQQQAPLLRITWILNPLWVGRWGVLDDHFAMCCISLERLAQAFEDKVEREQLPRFFSREHARTIRAAVETVVGPIADELELNEAQRRVLQSKVDNFCSPPNADKLAAVFRHLGVSLSESDFEIIKLRNTPLHGGTTLDDARDIDLSNQEVDRCERLHTLITLAVLRLLGYHGPMNNLASRTDADEVIYI